ncbi:hypothetical protein Tco_1494345 [Tanacetum coccineum]
MSLSIFSLKSDIFLHSDVWIIHDKPKLEMSSCSSGKSARFDVFMAGATPIFGSLGGCFWWNTNAGIVRVPEVVENIDAPAIASASTEGLIPPKTVEQKLARKNELKAKSTMLLAIPDEHLLKFHGIKDAKTLCEAIKARFRGNKESKKTQKTILKQQYENFTTSRSEGLDKTYDRFQKHISQLEIHGEVISQEYANLKLLRSLPSAWNNIALIMRNKVDLDELSMEDLYNNLKMYEAEIKSQSISSSNSQINESTQLSLSKDSLEQLKMLGPSAPIIKSGRKGILVKGNRPVMEQCSEAKPLPRAATSISTAKHVNTAALKQKFYGVKGIKREFSVSRTPQQNRVLKERIVTARNQTNGDAGIETNVNAGQAGQEKASDHEYILLPSCFLILHSLQVLRA